MSRTCVARGAVVATTGSDARARIESGVILRPSIPAISARRTRSTPEPSSRGVGRIYQQTFVDTYSKVAVAKLYTGKTAITAADLLNDRVLPAFEEQGGRVLRMLTDRGREYCDRLDEHPYQLFLAIDDIEVMPEDTADRSSPLYPTESKPPQ